MRTAFAKDTQPQFHADTDIPAPQPYAQEQTRETPPHVITDPTLAWDIAHAVDGNMEDAQKAMRKGEFGKAATSLAAAAATERQLGLQYVERLRAQFEGDAGDPAELGTAVEVETSLERWSNEAKQALSERYGRPVEEFELVTYEEPNGEVYEGVAHIAPNGIDLANSTEDYDSKRSWNTVQSTSDENVDWHTLTIDGQQYDDRKGMTRALYGAIVDHAKEMGLELPDSKDNKVKLRDGAEYYTWTMLTGERAGDVYALIAWVGDVGSVNQNWTFRDNDFRPLRVRPAVVRKQQK